MNARLPVYCALAILPGAAVMNAQPSGSAEQERAALNQYCVVCHNLGGRGGGGGGRRSDMRLKHDITLLGRLDDGIGFYRFVYNGGDKAYVGVMAQEVQTVRPDAVVRGRDGYLRVFYDKLGVKFETYNRWIASGARIPSTASNSH